MEWKMEALGGIAFMTSGGTPSKKHPEYYKNGTIPWVRSGELENGAIRDTEIMITPAGLDNSSAKIFPKGTLLIALYGATIGKLAYLDIEACTNQAVCGIFENDKVSLKYLYYFLLFHRPNLVKQGIGGAQPNISQTILKKLMVSYPVDRAEQLRIVARIEELFSELDNGVETLQKTKQQLAVYRQAVLKDVFDTSGDCENGTIQSVCSNVVDCPHSTPKWTDDGKICLRTTNFKRGYLDLSEKNYVSNDTFDRRNARLVPKPGDVLYSREGAILGIACIIPKNLSVCLGQRMMLLRTNEKMLGRFLMHYLNSPKVTSFVATKIGGSASPHVNVGDIKEFVVPIPTIDEQKKMLEQIESRLSVCESIETSVDTALHQAEAMQQSILKRAFEGGL